MKQYLIGIFVGVLLSVLVVLLLPKPKIDTADLDKLSNKIDSLNKELYIKDSLLFLKQDTVINNVIIYNENAEENISDIPNFDNNQRDNEWARHHSSKDSIPSRKWDILQQNRRRLDSATTKLERGI